MRSTFKPAFGLVLCALLEAFPKPGKATWSRHGIEVLQLQMGCFSTFHKGINLDTASLPGTFNLIFRNEAFVSQSLVRRAAQAKH